MGPSTLSSWALLIERTLSSRGIDAAELFRRAKLPPQSLADPNARYPLAGMQRLWSLAVAASGDECFGLDVGRAWHPTSFHALGYVALASRSLREALEYVGSYSRVISSGARVELVDAGREGALTLTNRLPVYSLPGSPAPMQASLAALAVLGRVVRKGVQLQRVTLTQAPSCRARMEEFFGCPVRFSAREDALVFRRADLDAPLATANPVLLRINAQFVEQYHARLESSQVSDRVRAELVRALPAGEIGQATIARALNMSLRSLQRKLTAEETSFRELLDTTRRQLAAQYAEDSTLSASETAYLLGFSEVSSLSRAMRRWRKRRARGAPFARISTGPGA